MEELRELLARYHSERGGSAAETAEGVRELSAMFNGITPHRPGYLARPNLRRAYVHYYLPVNAEKVLRVLREMDAYAPRRRKPRVLDFGCGPGTAAIAAMIHGPVGEVTLVDVVDEALDDARFFCHQFEVEPRTLHEVPDEKFDLIFAANVFAEHRAALEERLSDKGYMVVVEPALRETTRRLQRWRDEMVARGYKVAAPCLGRATCPCAFHGAANDVEACAQIRPVDAVAFKSVTFRAIYQVSTRKLTVIRRGIRIMIVRGDHY